MNQPRVFLVYCSCYSLNGLVKIKKRKIVLSGLASGHELLKINGVTMQLNINRDVRSLPSF